MPSGRIVIAGGSGFIGTNLSRTLSARGYAVTVLSRAAHSYKNGEYEYRSWDGESVAEWKDCLAGAKAIVNLAGSSINCRMTPASRARVLSSRTRSTSALAKAVQDCLEPPSVFLQTSAVGFYGDCRNPCDEDTPCGEGQLSEICREWESIFAEADFSVTRKVVARLGVVLGVGGGAFPPLYRLTNAFLGGSAGKGSQYMSWIHIRDLENILIAMLEEESYKGTYNVVGLAPATNAHFMVTLRRVMSRPWSPPIPGILLKVGCFLFNLNHELILTGQNVRPKKLIDQGIRFVYGEMNPALEDLVREMDQT